MATITFQDRAPLERVRKLSDGRIAAVARFARSGTQIYAGHEVGRPDLATVTVYRPESEVFDQASMASFAHKAVTLQHPTEAVDASNWREHAVGWTEGKIARDGEFLEIPLMLADAEAVRAYESGEARQLSAGYSSELIFDSGFAPDGTPYQARMGTVRGNHIALVPAARGGPALRIGDTMLDAKEKPLTSIDEALKARFATMAKAEGATVAEMLARMEQAKVEEIAAEVATAFVSGLAGTGVASRYSDSDVLLAKAAAGRMRRDALMGGQITNAAVRDAALAGRYSGGGLPLAGSHQSLGAHDASAGDTGRMVADLARASRYN